MRITNGRRLELRANGRCARSHRPSCRISSAIILMRNPRRRRKDFPYYKIQVYDEIVKVWKNERKAFDTLEAAQNQLKTRHLHEMLALWWSNAMADTY